MEIEDHEGTFDEPGLEGFLKLVLANHQNDEVNGALVIVFEGNKAGVYSSNIKQEILDKISDVLAVHH